MNEKEKYQRGQSDKKGQQNNQGKHAQSQGGQENKKPPSAGGQDGRKNPTRQPGR